MCACQGTRSNDVVGLYIEFTVPSTKMDKLKPLQQTGNLTTWFSCRQDNKIEYKPDGHSIAIT